MKFKKMRPMTAAMMTCILLSAGAVQAGGPDQALMTELARDVKAAFLKEDATMTVWIQLLKANWSKTSLKKDVLAMLGVVSTKHDKDCAAFADLREKAESLTREDLRTGFAATVARPVEWCAIHRRFMTSTVAVLSPEVLGKLDITVGGAVGSVSKNMGAELTSVKRLQGEFITSLQGSLAAAGLSTDLKTY